MAPQMRQRSTSLGEKDGRDIDTMLAIIGEVDEPVKPPVLVRKPTVKKTQMPILEGYLMKKKVQLGRVSWVRRYFRIHETLLLMNRKDTVRDPPPAFFPFSFFPCDSSPSSLDQRFVLVRVWN